MLNLFKVELIDNNKVLTFILVMLLMWPSSSIHMGLPSGRAGRVVVLITVGMMWQPVICGGGGVLFGSTTISSSESSPSHDIGRSILPSSSVVTTPFTPIILCFLVRKQTAGPFATTCITSASSSSSGSCCCSFFAKIFWSAEEGRGGDDVGGGGGWPPRNVTLSIVIQ